MSELTIRHDEFPQALPVQSRVGDEVTLTVRGTIRRIEAETVDTSTLDRTSYLPGAIETSILIAEVTPA